MSRFSRFSKQIFKFSFFKHNLAIDLGSTNTRILLDEKLVWNQPTCLVWDEKKESVLSLGSPALHWQGKSISTVKIINPVQQAAISNLSYGRIYLNALLQYLNLGKLQTLLGLDVVYGLPASASPVEKKQIGRVIRQVGCGRLKMRSKLESLVYLPSLQKISQAHCLIDLGGETVEVGLFLGSKPILTKTLFTGGSEYTTAVRDLIKTKYQCLVSDQVAAKIKHQVGFVPTNYGTPTKADLKNDSLSSKITVRGKNLLDGGIKTVRVSSQDFLPAFAKLSNSLVWEIKMVLGSASPELVSQALQQGIFLTGGGSQLNGLQSYLAKEFDCPVILSKQPELDTIQSLAIRK